MNVCTNCGAANVEVYCARCGGEAARPPRPDRRPLRHDVVHELVHLDSKLFRTLRDLIRRPGLLTVEYFAGQKKRSISPLRLFLTLFAIQFIAYTVYKPVAIYAVETMTRFDQGGALKEMLERKAAKHKMTVAQYSEKIDTRFRKISPCSSSSTSSAWRWCSGSSTSAGTWSMIYLYFAQRRFYGQGRGKTVLKTALTWGGHYVVSVILLGGALAAALIQYR